MRATTILGLILLAFLNGCSSVSREDLGVADPIPGQTCQATELPVYDNPKYNREVGANDYLLYAIASLNAYSGGDKHGFVLTKFASDWNKINSNPSRLGNGLAYDYYFREGPARLDVLVAFRGTELDDPKDWWANFSWITRFFGFHNEYDYAREEFSKVRKHAFSVAGKKTVYFITTGHSLGGALAQHVSFAFPCSSAAVFNTSFVINKYRLKQPFDSVRVVYIYENEDELTRLWRTISKDIETKFYYHYNMKLTPDPRFQHPMENLAVGMARMVVDCQLRNDCAISKQDRFAFKAYCESYGKIGPDELCKK